MVVLKLEMCLDTAGSILVKRHAPVMCSNNWDPWMDVCFDTSVELQFTNLLEQKLYRLGVGPPPVGWNKLVLPGQLCKSLYWFMDLVGPRFPTPRLRIG